MEKTLLSILLLTPVIGFLINGIRFRSKNIKVAGSIGTGAALISFICSVALFFKVKAAPDHMVLVKFFDWINIGSLNIAAEFLVDPISSIMILIITGVGTLIHLFSIGYMDHDERPAKYFSYLNFFLFNMLVLVLASSLPLMFVGWEGVGLCSYLLIGFWFTDKEKAAAGMKAFITNRIGDAGFLLGMFMLFYTFGTLSFGELNEMMPAIPEIGWAGPVTLACLFLFIGATGKSAQIPLYVWLPDAMAGPTPVSALIHAATMVTAGIYMIVRMSPVFMVAPNVMMVIATIGGLTAVLAAAVGLTQWDIKKVLAYSTVSQLGYMFLAVGTGAFIPGFFHLMTHAFFKALMFLGAGSIIHAMHHEQDMRKMGGLKKKMPITYWTFMFGWLAIIGMPPFAGFFSKDEILWLAWASPLGSKWLWALGMIGAAMTAFYMTRLMCLVFWGEETRSDHKVKESGLTMTFPLMVLGFLSATAGFLGIPHVISAVLPGHPPNILGDWLGHTVVHLDIHGSAITEWLLMGWSVTVAGASALLAYYCYIKKITFVDKFTEQFKPLHQLVEKKYLVDELYQAKIITPLIGVSKILWSDIDVSFVDKCTHLLSRFAVSCGKGFRSFQNGNMQTYAFYMLLGSAVTLFYIMTGMGK